MRVLALAICLVFSVFGQIGRFSVPIPQNAPLVGMTHSGHAYLENQFRPGTDIGIFREDGATVYYWPSIAIGEGRYAAFGLETITGGVHALNPLQIRAPMVLTDQDDVTWTRVGAGWAVNGNNAGTYGGTYDYSQTATETASFVTPANTRMVALKIFQTTNGGIAKVSIDGDATTATGLSTAQALVDAGTLANTVLAANGGTLQPTDRVINCYRSSGLDLTVLLSDALIPGEHTILVTVTGYKQAASSAARVYLTGTYHQTVTTIMSTAAVQMVDLGVAPNARVNSVWEYAVQLNPTGAAQTVFQGNRHAYDVESAFSILVDGSAVTLANNEVRGAASSLTITRTSGLKHPDIGAGATDIATVSLTYRMLPSIGLDVQFSITMLTAGTAYTSYPAMMPVSPLIDKGSTLGATADADLTANDGTYKAAAQGSAVWMWDADGLYGVMAEFPDVTTSANNWTYATTVGNANLLSLEDRADGLLNKGYLTRIATGNSVAYAQGDVWTGHSIYKCMRFPDGADNALKRR